MPKFVPFACVVATLLLVQAGDAFGDDAQVVLKGLDAVSLLEGREQRGEEKYSSTEGRFRYLFADAEHKARFDEAPGRFAAQGDKCTVMPKVPANPDLFLVHEGKLFLFGSPRCLASFKADPAAYFKPKKNVAVLVYEGMELLDFAGPAEVFSAAGGGRAFEVFAVAASPGPVKSLGFAFTPHYTFSDCPKADVLVLPGGATRIPLADPAVVDWVKEKSGEAEVVVSVCTGALLLAKAGLLDGLEATTHKASLEALREAAPKTVVKEGVRFVDNGKVVTSAGVSAGIDASLHVVERLLGPEGAARTAEYMEYRRGPETGGDSR
ncbi:DJ-1/PfpI family protein [Paludisphaera mucosa]|uniref:DJ-1/PfpI family protein n=1 Tax=Paludisphaera mucosa TaxID=3030827 RepID=A0ABT6FLS2_9BACT|nr:DJ-1/PfpI family protein [Paludisphaera mucosa]MDG3008323.1 DJ-1/PfpI family protein [Paludisphaera mucosa]